MSIKPNELYFKKRQLKTVFKWSLLEDLEFIDSLSNSKVMYNAVAELSGDLLFTPYFGRETSYKNYMKLFMHFCKPNQK